MSDDTEIKGPERVWVRVTRGHGRDIVDQHSPGGVWVRHATSSEPALESSGTWRGYVRADVVAEQAPRIDLPDHIDWQLVRAVLLEAYEDHRNDGPVDTHIARLVLLAATQIAEVLGD